MGEEMARARKAPAKVASAAKVARTSSKTRKGAASNGVKPGERRGGRKKGTPNKFTADLKRAILEACEASDKGGTVGYLKKVAKNDPRTFCGLLGKVLPMTIASDGDNPLIPDTIKVEIVDAPGAGTA